MQVDEILITHLHADHYLGLPGLLKTYDLQDRQAPLRIAGPPGLRGLFEALRRIFGKIRYEVELVELQPGEALDADEGFEMRAFEVEHRMPANGYALRRARAPRAASTPTPARELGVSDVRDFGGCSAERRSRAPTARCAPSRCWARPARAARS